MGPVVAPSGTGTTILFGVQLAGMVAAVPLKRTTLVESKPVPVTVIGVPTAPLVGEKVDALGLTANASPLCTEYVVAATVIGPDTAAAGTFAVIVPPETVND